MLKALGGTSFMCSLLGMYHTGSSYHIAVRIIRYHTWYCNDLMGLVHSGSHPFNWLTSTLCRCRALIFTHVIASAKNQDIMLLVMRQINMEL